MSRVEDTAATWIEGVMSVIIKNLGLNGDKVRYEVSKTNDNFMSTQYYVCVKFKDATKGGDEVEYFMILKRPAQCDSLLELDVDSQFHNEILFYRMYARPEDNIPRCYHADERPPNDSVVALQNVSDRGYLALPFKHNAPLAYTLAAVRELGRYHGKGYVMKERQREKFFDITKRIIEIRYYDETREQPCKPFINQNATRAVDYLRNHGHDEVFCDKAEAFFANAHDNVMLKMVNPSGDLATLCHGDFTLSNMLFKTENDGQYRAMLIDFAFMRYGTPVVDLSTYLCVCCFNDTSKSQFFEIMRAYHDALKEYLLDADIWDDEKYSYDAFVDDYMRGGLWGFVIASFYLPTLLGHVPIKFLKTEFTNWAEFGKRNICLGGDKISKILADMLLHLSDLGCLKHIL